MHVDPGGIWSGTQGPLPPTHVLGEATDGGVGRRIIQRTLQWGERCDTGGPDFTHHI